MNFSLDDKRNNIKCRITLDQEAKNQDFTVHLYTFTLVLILRLSEHYMKATEELEVNPKSFVQVSGDFVFLMQY